MLDMIRLKQIVFLLLFNFLAFSQDKNNTYILLDDNEELIIHDEHYYYIFSNKKDLEDYYYYKNNKFPLKDTITGELDLSQMGKPKPYLEFSAKIKDTSYISQEEYKNLNVFTHGEFTKNFTRLRKNNYDFFSSKK